MSPSQQYEKMNRKPLLIILKDKYTLGRGKRSTVDPDKIVTRKNRIWEKNRKNKDDDRDDTSNNSGDNDHSTHFHQKENYVVVLEKKR